MEWGFLPMIFIATVQSTPPLLIAGLGELITEKSGVLNLGVEGMMLVGAVFAFIVAFITDSFWLGATAGIGAGIVMAALFALLTVFLRANQVACGLALTIFGAGFSAFVGLEYEGKSLTSPPAYKIPFLGDIPVLGPMLFNYQVPVYFAVLLLSVTVWFLLHTRAGLILRAVGENHHAARENGLSGVVDSLRRGYLRRRIMRSCGGLFIYFLHAPVGAKHDRRTGLDSSRARGFRLLASVALGDGGVFVRFYRNYEFFAASLGSIHYAAIFGHGTISCNNCRFSDNIIILEAARAIHRRHTAVFRTTFPAQVIKTHTGENDENKNKYYCGLVRNLGFAGASGRPKSRFCLC